MVDSTPVKVRAILARVLRIPAESVTGLGRAETPAWDSLRHLELVFQLEEEFDIRIEPEDVQQLQSFETIAEFVERARAA